MKLAHLGLKLTKKYVALIVVGGTLAVTGSVFAATHLVVTATPDTGLTNGQTVTVTGSGFDSDSPGAFLECNDDGFSNDTVQPTALSEGNQVPVSCSIPLVRATDGNGNLPSTKFVVHTGTVGPPSSNTTEKDSAGNPANVDAAKFPCPPTAAQIKAGFSCIITFGDFQNQDSSTNITFAGQTAQSHTATTSHTATVSHTATGGNGGGTSQGQSSSGSSASSASQLANTGPGTVALVAALIAAVSGSAIYLIYRFKKVKN